MAGSGNVDDYIFTELIGEGGFGRVYRAENTVTN